MYYVMEVQKKSANTIAHLVTPVPGTKNDADSAYCLARASAAISGLEKHVVALLSENLDVLEKAIYTDEGE